MEEVSTILSMALDWPFGTIGIFIIYCVLVNLVRALISGFSLRLCSYEFEILEN